MNPSSPDEPQKPQNENTSDEISIPVQSGNNMAQSGSSNVTSGRDNSNVVQPQIIQPQVIRPTQSTPSEDASFNTSDDTTDTGSGFDAVLPSETSEEPINGMGQASDRSDSFNGTALGPDRSYTNPSNQSNQTQTDSTQSSPMVGKVDTNNLFQPDAGSQISPQSTGKGKGRKLAIFAGVLAVVLLLVGVGAGAYYGYVLPNKPENVLRQAIKNTSEQDYYNTNTTLNVSSSAENNNYAYKVIALTNSDVENKTYEAKLALTASGVDFKLDVRYVNKSAYIKVGDLDTVIALAGSAVSGFGDGEQIGSELKKAGDVIEDQWIKVDSTLLDQVKASCSLDSDFRLSDSDLALIESQFKKHSFASIDNTSNDKVNENKAIKYSITLDVDKLNKFAEDNKLEELSIIKKLKECNKDNDALNPEDLKDKAKQTSKGEKYKFDLWVDTKTKLISRVAANADEQKDVPKGFSGSIDMNLTYDKVSVEEPSDAKSVVQIIADIQQASPELFSIVGMLLSGFSSSDFTDSAPELTEQPDVFMQQNGAVDNL